MNNEIRTSDPVDSIKDVVRSSVKVSEFDKHLKKAGVEDLEFTRLNRRQ